MSQTEARIEAQTFSAAFRAHYADVLNFVRRRVGDVAHAEDLTAEVFSRAWQGRVGVSASENPGSGKSARPWLFGIARHVIIDSYRSEERRSKLDQQLTQLPLTVPDAATSTDAVVDLQSAWGKLTPADREVLALVAWDGLTGDEAAAVLGCSRAAYSVRLTRARRRLRLLLNLPAATKQLANNT